MSISVPLGQFIPGDTPVHKLDARAKFVALIAISVALFVSTTWWGLALCALIVAGTYVLSGISPTLALRGLKPVIFLLIITILLNTIGPLDLGAGAQPVLGINIGGYGIVVSGLIRGLYFAARIVILIVTTSLLTYTTSPVALTDALVSLMRPLGVLHVPIEDIAMMFSIALRFIPITAEEADKIVVAQTARGALFNDKNLMKRLKAWIPVLIPLFVNLFRRADALAVAMESRCYRGEGRTHLRQYKLRLSDITTMIACVVAATVISVWL